MEAEADSGQKDKFRAFLAVIFIGFICIFGLLWVIAPHRINLPCKPENQSIQQCPSDNFPSYIVSGSLAYVDIHNGLFQALAAIASAVFAGVLYKVTREQIRLTRQSVDAAIRQVALNERDFEANKRPWLSIDAKIVGPLIFNPGQGGEMGIEISLDNSGISVANNVRYYGTILFDDFIDLKSHFSGMREWPTGHGNVVFPKEHFTDKFTIRFGEPAIDSFKTKRLEIFKEMQDKGIDAAVWNAMANTPHITLVIGVDYQSAYSREHHQTGRAFTILQSDPRNPDSGFAIDIRSPFIPLHLLKLSRYLFGGSYAD